MKSLFGHMVAKPVMLSSQIMTWKLSMQVAVQFPVVDLLYNCCLLLCGSWCFICWSDTNSTYESYHNSLQVFSYNMVWHYMYVKESYSENNTKLVHPTSICIRAYRALKARCAQHTFVALDNFPIIIFLKYEWTLNISEFLIHQRNVCQMKICNYCFKLIVEFHPMCKHCFSLAIWASKFGILNMAADCDTCFYCH